MKPEIFYKDETGLRALTSDASLDFTPLDFDSPLTDCQQRYLRQYAGVDIPEVFWRKQVHGDEVLVLSHGSQDRAIYRACQGADAFITKSLNLPLAIRTADCVPVFIFDPIHKAIGLAHAGWKGTYQQIGVKTIEKMRQAYGSAPAQLKVVLGPAIRSCCYQVGEEFEGYFPQHVKLRDGKRYVDIISVNCEQLLQGGVKTENIVDSGICTCCDKNYFSFRRQGAQAGRMISLMMLLS
ncbi:MAG: peptidoglycan editing factor PgeF [Candidatus Omnitrophica bacterium]|nr:peptidoglycan editing factor PgeF [Candidatus Omnitrophota bacterium]